jgi:predicted nucleic acid-binding protein
LAYLGHAEVLITGDDDLLVLAEQLPFAEPQQLGFSIPYRKQGVPSTYIPDFIVELCTRQKNLTV